jgi:hypothetical protein
MPERKTAAKAPATKRVKLTLPSKEAKAWTSEGKLVSGSVVELPTDEADYFIAADLAYPFDGEVDAIAPEVDPESMRVPSELIPE